jgi:succinate-acetate transporter protein
MKPAQKFHITESQMVTLSGYSRQQLRQARSGTKQVKNGKTYVYLAFLSLGVHFAIYGRAVLYADCAVEVLKDKKGG